MRIILYYSQHAARRRYDIMFNIVIIILPFFVCFSCLPHHNNSHSILIKIIIIKCSCCIKKIYLTYVYCGWNRYAARLSGNVMCTTCVQTYLFRNDPPVRQYLLDINKWNIWLSETDGWIVKFFFILNL